MTHKITVPCPFAGGDLDVLIEFDYSPGRPAVMYLRNGDPGYPADPEEVAFISAIPADGSVLSDFAMRILQEWADLWLAGDGFEQACEAAWEDTTR